jgi:hypothetical protein
MISKSFDGDFSELGVVVEGVGNSRLPKPRRREPSLPEPCCDEMHYMLDK